MMVNYRLISTRPFGDLSNYNAERMRGLVHTDEWKELMREEQERFNAGLPSLAEGTS